jgi:chemotaxis protein methyltransferase CheR
VALAGSANSLDKILAIIERLPPSEVSIFIAQHVLEDRENLLDQLLKVRTDYSVVMPQQLMKVQPRTIYVAPPGFHMRVAHGLIYLTHDRLISYARPSIDVLFESLAAEYGATALVALLCGFGQDGADLIVDLVLGRSSHSFGLSNLFPELDQQVDARDGHCLANFHHQRQQCLRVHRVLFC